MDIVDIHLWYNKMVIDYIYNIKSATPPSSLPAPPTAD